MNVQETGQDSARGQFRYDAQGRLTEIRRLSGGKMIISTTFQYNDRGDISRRINASGVSAYTYTYDTHGNWTKCVESTVSQKHGKDVLAPKEATYRALVYSAPAKEK